MFGKGQADSHWADCLERVIQIQIVKRYADSHWADCRRFLASKHICLVMEIATGAECFSRRAVL